MNNNIYSSHKNLLSKTKIKISSGILSAILALALIVSGSSPVAHANDIFDQNYWEGLARYDDDNVWYVAKSRELDYYEQKHNRQVRVTIDYYGSHGSPFVARIVERTGTFSYEDYFDCHGNEVSYASGKRCRIKLFPHDSYTLIVKMGDSSWWKARTGVYLRVEATGGTPIQNALKYSMTIIN
ncbi:MAG: hypothetical protein LBT91_03865 [Bifidobacteriaceae bacterium]|nr:hypothetical protein [Bifidobacteriaceae bacterium]